MIPENTKPLTPLQIRAGLVWCNDECTVGIAKEEYVGKCRVESGNPVIYIGKVALEYLCEFADKLSEETSGEIKLSFIRGKSGAPLLIAEYDKEWFVVLGGIGE